MNSRDFCFWLQGFFELRENDQDGCVKSINAREALLIAKHLNLVFAHEIDPSMGDNTHQEKLNDIHSGNIKLRC